ncbi:MAG: metallophosphoesterase [Treponema sp.]|jgi:putative phosphoesterase|nr:metallophosphoesterase [Treponema sp.]
MKYPSLLVISDSHDDTASLESAMRWGMKRGVDALVFLGDGSAGFPQAAASAGFTLPWKMVRGNTDALSSAPCIDTLSFAGHVFFLTHGHLSGVDKDLGAITGAAKSAGCDAALYGHTHVPYWEEIDGILVLNPGSAGKPRSAAGACFATIECPPGEWFIIRYWKIEGAPGRSKKIREISQVFH